jgi:Glycosyl hydrolases family 39
MKRLIKQQFAAPAASSVRASTRKPKILKSLIFGILLAPSLISGSKCLAAATVSPSSLSWASVSLGNVGAPKSVTLTNGGSASISIRGIAFTGTNAADFIISSKTCGSTLAAKAGCTVAIRFKPSATGTRTATLTITDSASNSPQKVALSGLGTAAVVAASPSTLAFGNIYAGSSGRSLSVALNNGTSTSVAISNMAIAGTNAADFAISGKTCGLTLAAYSSCTATILFKTAAVGTRAATLSFIDSASSSPQKVSLSGTGIAPTGNLSLSPANINWAIVSVGVGGAPKSATLTNSGTTVIPISSIALSSTDPGDFYISGKTCGTQLAVGASCAITLVFKPKAIGTRVALLTITDGAINSPHTVTVSGSGGPRTAVAASISVDFGSRSGTQIPVPSGMLGAHYLAGDPYWQIVSDAANQAGVVQAGLKSTRMHANIPNVYATTTPDWTKIDGWIKSLQGLGVHPILEMDFTPPWLQPATLLCPNNPVTSVPADLTKWGQMAASFVAHFDQAFPGVVLDYEIWNEPDGPSLCSNNKLNDYLAIYAAAAPLMKAQAKTDGVSIRVGGPATATVGMTSLLTDPRTAPFVDFYSYHTYLSGPTEIQQGMTWDGAGGTPSLLSLILNSSTGEQAQYLKAVAAVQLAKTPLGTMTPIYLDEFNDNWSFNPDCCRNSPTYSPLFNSLAVAQILNSAYTGANELPGKMVYYSAASNPSSFCLRGIADAAMDCAPSDSSANASPYPQWYTYQLIAAPGYLDLMDGGFMAKSVTLSSAAKAQGLVATGFYTATSDSILIINPTASSFAGVTLQISNSGWTWPQSTFFTLNSANLKVSSWPASMVAATNGTQMTFDIPPNSVLGISLRAN